MKRELLASGTASDFVNARGTIRAQVMDIARAGHRIGLGTPILGELIGGVMASNDPTRPLRRRRPEIAPLRLWAFDVGAANEYGKRFAELRAAGRLRQVPDMQLAAIARHLGNSVVVSKDSDLRAVPASVTPSTS